MNLTGVGGTAFTAYYTGIFSLQQSERAVDSDNNQAFLEEVAKRFKTWVIEKSKYEYPRLYESVSSTFAN